MALVGCSQKPPTAHEPTVAELDSIRHKQINDSINNLDTISILGSLFMGMTPIEYSYIIENNLQDFYKNGVVIGSLKFSMVDTAMYHHNVHTIRIKVSDSKTENDETWIHRQRKWSEKNFGEVIRVLSEKYGKPSWVIDLSPMGEYRGFQQGVANWDFDKLNISYEQKQWTYQRATYLYEHRVEACMSYNIPRIPTTEEKNKADSIANEMNKQRSAEMQRNDSLKSLL